MDGWMDDDDGGGIVINTMQSNSNAKKNKHVWCSVLLCAKQYTFFIKCKSKNANNNKKMNKKFNIEYIYRITARYIRDRSRNGTSKIRTKFHPFSSPLNVSFFFRCCRRRTNVRFIHSSVHIFSACVLFLPSLPTCSETKIIITIIEILIVIFM